MNINAVFGGCHTYGNVVRKPFPRLEGKSGRDFGTGAGVAQPTNVHLSFCR